MIDVDSEITQASRDVYSHFRAYVSLEDLRQEGFLWVYSHKKAMAEYLGAEGDDERKAAYRLRRDSRKAIERYARRERAAFVGYEPDDEAGYGRTVLSLMLPYVLAGDSSPPQRGDAEAPRTKSDPAEGGGWLVMWLDVDWAWQSADLTDDQRELLVQRFTTDSTLVELADAWLVDPRTITRRLNKALDTLSGFLGGTVPQGCPWDCECHEGRLRARPGPHSTI